MPEQYQNAAGAVAWASTWIERNQSVTPDLKNLTPELLLELARTRSTLDYTVHNLTTRPTIGLFGASQAGKSYLVSSLAAGSAGVLQTHWDNAEIKFIKHVNPSGNNSEATGFATRFTHQPADSIPGFPVELQVLQEMELAMILINAFFADINQGDVQVQNDENYFLKRLQDLEPQVDTQAQAHYLAFPSRELNRLSTLAAAAPRNAAAAGSASDDAGSAGGESDSSSILPLSLLEQPGVMPGKLISVAGKQEYNYISPEQVIEMADYVTANSKGKLAPVEQMPRLWLKLRSMLPFMTLSGRIQALSMFWQDLPIFSETYRALASELLLLQGRSKIWAPREAFVTVKGDALEQQASGTIMHITKLGTMFVDTATLTCALGSSAAGAAAGAAENTGAAGAAGAAASAAGAAAGTGGLMTATVTVSKLAALARELIFHLEGEPRLGPLSLDNFDVLDLPGARSRDEVQYQDVVADGKAFVPGQALSEAMQMRGSEFFRRGKVAYLFERYARRNEIDQLLFCIGVNAQQDVTSVLTILSSWIDKNVGNTPQKRASGYNPLTIVLTRYDEVFNRQLRNIDNGLPIDMNQEINIAFNRIQKLNWFKEWTPNQPFARVLLARTPKLGDLNPWLNSDPQTKQELAIGEQYQAGIAEIKAALLQVPDFKAHVAHQAQAIDAVLTLNDGGVSNIMATIGANAQSQEERQAKCTFKSRWGLQESGARLNPFAKRDGALALAKTKALSQELALGLLQCNAIAPCFDLLRQLLEIDELRLSELYFQGFSMGSNVQRFVQDVASEYMDNLAQLWRQDNVRLNQIAEMISNAYAAVSANIAADPQNQLCFSFFYNVSEGRFKSVPELKSDIVKLFNLIFTEIGKTFNSPQINLKAKMAEVLLASENINEGFTDMVRVQVPLMYNLLSDFNLYLGANLLPDPQAVSAATAASTAASAAAATTMPAPGALPGAAYGAPAAGAGGYGAPAIGAGGYGALGSVPAGSYGAASPGLGYGAPAGSYGAPAAGGGAYGAPVSGDEDDFSDLALPGGAAGPYGAAPAGGYGTASAPAYGAVPGTMPGTIPGAMPGTMPGGIPGAMPGGAAAAGAGATAAASPTSVGEVPSVLGTAAGPQNSFIATQGRISLSEGANTQAAFISTYEADDTGLLPHLNAATADYEFKFVSDLAATLMYMMTKVNVLTESKYQFSAEENLLLCRILSTMENCN